MYRFKFILVSSTFPIDSITLRDFSAPSRSSHHGERPPSCHPILTPDYEIRPSLVAMVRSQSFSGRRDENPYTHLREFDQNCSIISIPGMHHETVKWILFPFSLTGRAKDWYSITVGSVEGDWNALKEKFCLCYYHSSKIIKLRIEVLCFPTERTPSLHLPTNTAIILHSLNAEAVSFATRPVMEFNPGKMCGL